MKGKVIMMDRKNIDKLQVMEYSEITYDIDEFGSKAIVYCKDEKGNLKAIYNLNNPTVQCVLWDR